MCDLYQINWSKKKLDRTDRSSFCVFSFSCNYYFVAFGASAGFIAEGVAAVVVAGAAVAGVAGAVVAGVAGAVVAGVAGLTAFVFVLFALLAGASPQAIPKEPITRTADSAIIFFITIDSPVCLRY